MSQPQYEAWLIDFDGTLYRPTPVKAWMALELLCFGAMHFRTLRKFRHEHERIRETQSEAMADPFQLQIQRTAEALGIDSARVAALVNSWMFERPQKWIRRHVRTQLLDEVRHFRSQGGKVAVVSDYPVSAKIKAIQPELDLDVIIASGERGGPGRLKPYPDGYLKAAECVGVSPARCLVIGDRKDADGLAAERAGMAFRLIG
jgi:HAD superfamily hydrolase (TIGR01549 family)